MTVEIFEVRELISLIFINMEQGIEIDKTFTLPFDKVNAIKWFVLQKAILKRQTMTIV